MKKAVSVTLEYWGHFRNATSEDYSIKKISGAVTVQVAQKGEWVPARVGEMITEAQAEELSTRVDVNTLPKEGSNR